MQKYKSIFKASLFIGLSTFILNLMILLYWQRDGFDFLEISFMSIITGLLFFTLTIIFNIILLNKGIKALRSKGELSLKRFYQVLICLILSLVVFLIFDALHFLIDDSLPREFANTLREMAERNGSELPGIEDFENLPFGVQNVIVTFVFGLIAALISLIFIKKDGDLFKSEYNSEY